MKMIIEQRPVLLFSLDCVAVLYNYPFVQLKVSRKEAKKQSRKEGSVFLYNGSKHW